LEAAAAGDPDRFWSLGMKDGNPDKVDAISSVWTLLAVLKKVPGGGKGRILAYGQAPAPGGGMVSFGAVTLD
jgi:hypothetical protein